MKQIQITTKSYNNDIDLDIIASIKTAGMKNNFILPFYPVFDDAICQQVLVEYLKELVGIPARPPTSSKKGDKGGAQASSVELDD